MSLPAGIKEGDAPLPFAITDEQRSRSMRMVLVVGVLRLLISMSGSRTCAVRPTGKCRTRTSGRWSGVASGLYDYIQRSVWASNDAFANFLLLAVGLGARWLR